MKIVTTEVFLGGLVSFCSAWIILRLSSKFVWLRFDHGSGPQRIHEAHTPRIGGVAVFIGGCVTFLVFLPSSFGVSMLVCAVPVFAIGVAEDLTNRISAFVRLLVSIFSAC